MNIAGLVRRGKPAPLSVGPVQCAVLRIVFCCGQWLSSTLGPSVLHARLIGSGVTSVSVGAQSYRGGATPGGNSGNLCGRSQTVLLQAPGCAVARVPRVQLGNGAMHECKIVNSHKYSTCPWYSKHRYGIIHLTMSDTISIEKKTVY